MKHVDVYNVEIGNGCQRIPFRPSHPSLTLPARLRHDVVRQLYQRDPRVDQGAQGEPSRHLSGA